MKSTICLEKKNFFIIQNTYKKGKIHVFYNETFNRHAHFCFTYGNIFKML